MINAHATLSIALGLIALICWYAAVIAWDRNAQLQASRAKVQDNALDLLIDCALLKERNEWLELHNDALAQRQIYCREVIGASMLHIPARLSRLIKSEDKRMCVKEGQAP